ncbi:MAG: Branched-chain amino acid transport system 2 carrier protein [Chlamydiia bacterium]|nr:Branched-chain amino acid transport system 2 carrier protein [Chlamydiia bacterium]
MSNVAIEKQGMQPWIGNGLAIFSMFFGAGNVIFPLIVGQHIQGGVFYALLGLILTAVCVPFTGLFSISLFNGDYWKFFGRAGKWAGLAFMVMTLALIGPFGGAPRCVSLTFSTISVYLPELSVVWFSLGFCAIIYLFSVSRGRILDVLGYVLTPFLLLFLAIFVVKGVLSPNHLPVAGVPGAGESFVYGLKQGYNTMDLLAALFFGSIVCSRFKAGKGMAGSSVGRPFVYAALLGGGLLAAVYAGFGFVAAHFSGELAGYPSDQMLGAIGQAVLGPYAGITVSMIVVLSCLTTAIALTVVATEFIQEHVFRHKVGYQPCLLMVLVITFLVSTLKFTGITAILGPILTVCYPAFLALAVLNIFHKLYKLESTKVPLYILLALIFGYQILL